MITCFFEDNNKGSLRHVVMDALVIKDNKILLVMRAKHLTGGGKLALPGGFLDRNETTKDGILRELKEETGLLGEIITLFRVIDNPNRIGENRQNVSFVYLIKPIKKISDYDKNEVTDVFWFDLNSLPDKSSIAFDHYENIILYKEYLKEKFSLPIFSPAKKK